MSHAPDSVIDVSGTTPGTDSNVDVMWTSVDQPMRNFFAVAGVRRVSLSIDHSHAGTLKWYRSMDGGTSWTQIGTQALTAVANEVNTVDILVEGERDWRIDWTNGGTAQSPWSALLTLASDRVNAA